MSLAPDRFAVEPSTVTQKETLQSGFCRTEFIFRLPPSADDVANRFMRFVRHPHRDQLAGAQQTG